MTDLICIVCPRGCHLQVDEENGYAVTGNTCQRGETYGQNELKNPTRMLTSTVAITNAAHRRCPVKTARPIPKGLIMEAMALLKDITLASPVREGDIVVKDICQTGIPFVVTRDLQADSVR